MSVRFKLDENLGTRTREILAAAGHDVATVREEGLQGSSDASLYETCRREGRCLVTLDLDFSDVIRFPPALTSGLVVFRPGREISLRMLRFLASGWPRPSTNTHFKATYGSWSPAGSEFETTEMARKANAPDTRRSRRHINIRATPLVALGTES